MQNNNILFTSYDSKESISTNVNLYQSISMSLHRGPYMSDHVLLNLSNDFGKSDKMRALLNTNITFSQQVQ